MRRLLLFTLFLVILAMLATMVLAVHGDLKVPWFSFAGGGGSSSNGGRFSVAGTIGQAGAGQLTDGSRFAVEGGFVSGLPGQESRWNVYLPLIDRW